jgi:phage/plasmid primase-like uncharacterized protein
MSAAHERWIADARGVRIEHEIQRRGIHLSGRIDRCGPCPVCGGRDRFSINIRKQVFHCRPCSGGDVIALVQHLDGCGFLAAVQSLAGGPPVASVAPRAKSASGSSTVEETEEYQQEQRRKAVCMWSRRKPIADSFKRPRL